MSVPSSRPIVTVTHRTPAPRIDLKLRHERRWSARLRPEARERPSMTDRRHPVRRHLLSNGYRLTDLLRAKSQRLCCDPRASARSRRWERNLIRQLYFSDSLLAKGYRARPTDRPFRDGGGAPIRPQGGCHETSHLQFGIGVSHPLFSSALSAAWGSLRYRSSGALIWSTLSVLAVTVMPGIPRSIGKFVH